MSEHIDEILKNLSTTGSAVVWYADESDDCVRIFRGNLQILKIPKRGTPYAEYWPSADMLRWILDALNEKAERERNET